MEMHQNVLKRLFGVSGSVVTTSYGPCGSPLPSTAVVFEASKQLGTLRVSGGVLSALSLQGLRGSQLLPADS